MRTKVRVAGAVLVAVVAGAGSIEAQPRPAPEMSLFDQLTRANLATHQAALEVSSREGEVGAGSEDTERIAGCYASIVQRRQMEITKMCFPGTNRLLARWLEDPGAPSDARTACTLLRALRRSLRVLANGRDQRFTTGGRSYACSEPAVPLPRVLADAIAALERAAPRCAR